MKMLLLGSSSIYNIYVNDLKYKNKFTNSKNPSLNEL